jgi:hypothetical protein
MVYANNFVAIYSRTCFWALMEVRENNPYESPEKPY